MKEDRTFPLFLFLIKKKNICILKKILHIYK